MLLKLFRLINIRSLEEELLHTRRKCIKSHTLIRTVSLLLFNAAPASQEKNVARFILAVVVSVTFIL
jgi:hypothetical protein